MSTLAVGILDYFLFLFVYFWFMVLLDRASDIRDLVSILCTYLLIMSIL